MSFIHTSRPGPRSLLDGVDDLLGDITTFPLPELSPQIREMLRSSPERTAELLRALEHEDPHLALRTLQVMNTSFFGVTRRIRSLPEGVEMLGAPLAAGFLACAEVFLAFETVHVPRMSMEHFESFSIRVGRLAHRFAEGLERAPEACIAGMLLDVGKLALAVRRPVAFAAAVEAALDSGRPSDLVERDHMGVGHPEVGARLLEIWGFAPTIIEPVACHHTPRSATSDLRLVAAVHAADALLGIVMCRDAESMLDLPFLEENGLLPMLPGWRALATEEATRVRR